MSRDMPINNSRNRRSFMIRKSWRIYRIWGSRIRRSLAHMISLQLIMHNLLLGHLMEILRRRIWIIKRKPRRNKSLIVELPISNCLKMIGLWILKHRCKRCRMSLKRRIFRSYMVNRCWKINLMETLNNNI